MNTRPKHHFTNNPEFVQLCEKLWDYLSNYGVKTAELQLIYQAIETAVDISEAKERLHRKMRGL